MTMPTRAVAMLVILVVIAVWSGGPADAQSTRRPNILVIVADDMGYTDLGV